MMCTQKAHMVRNFCRIPEYLIFWIIFRGKNHKFFWPQYDQIQLLNHCSLFIQCLCTYRINFRGKGHDLHSKKIQKISFFLSKKVKFQGDFTCKKRRFFCIKKKNVLHKIVKKREKISGDPQIFSGDELHIKGFQEKNNEFFHHIIMIFGSKSEKIR